MLRRVFARRKVHFLHIGKTGGSALSCALRGYLTSGRYEIVFHPHHIRLRDVPKGEKIVYFLRDPVSRFVSGFYSRQRQGQPRYHAPWTEDEKIAFERFQSPEQLALALSSANDEENRAAQHAMNSIIHVKDSYWTWFESEEYCKSRLRDILFVGFQEQLADDFAILKSKLKLPESVKLPDDDLKAHRNAAGLDRKLCDDAVRNLNEWYRDDYRFMEFSRQIARKKVG